MRFWIPPARRLLFISLVIFLGFIVILLVVFYRLRHTVPESSPPQGESSSPSPLTTRQKEKQIVYATFNQDLTADVFVFGGKDNASSKIASLPLQVKNITPVDSTTLLYLKNLDPFDRGDGIYQYAHGQETKLVSPQSGFVFDRFSLSPDRNRLVIWEVADGPFLAQSVSRIIVVSLKNPLLRTPLSEETGGDMTKYPMGWFGNDRILIDTFSTYGGGFFRGLSVYDLHTNTNQTILREGEYSSLPIVSPDGTRLAVTAYNKSARVQLPPLSVTSQLSRVELRNPNMIIEYDSKKGQRATTIESLDGELFETLAYSPDGSSLTYHSRTIATAENQSISTAIRQVDRTTHIITPIDDTGNGAVVGWLDDTTLLVAKNTALASPLGGILAPYSQIIEGLYTFSTEQKLYTKFLSDKPLQIVGIIN